MKTTQFGRPPRPAHHKGVETRSMHVPMSDGTKIAVDVMRPGDADPKTRLPTILIIARYWRSFALRGPAPRNRAPIGPRKALPDFLLARGYAVVIADSRGSGASTGATPYPFNDDELRDYRELVDWIIGQTWSDGSVGSTGISYEGIAAELLTVAHPAVRVVVPQQADIDQYAEFLFPGGIRNEWLITTWQHTNEALDQNQVPTEWSPGRREGYSLLHRVAGRLSLSLLKGVRPVDADTDGGLLEDAVSDHTRNADVAAFSRAVTFRDDPFGSSGVIIDDFSTIRYREEIERSGAAIFSWGSWLDGSTADGVIRRFASYSNPQRGVIGAWSHGFLNHGSPYCAPGAKLRPDLRALWQEIADYFERHIRSTHDGKGDPNRLLHYYTLGEETWKATDVWPPAGTTTQRWYLAPENRLSLESPSSTVDADSYTVDFEATTGRNNRWRTQDGVTKVIYRDRAQADERLLTYTSPPLAEDIELTGHPVVTLHASSTADDGAFYVYLEDVDEAGRVTYLTEGQIRAIHRRMSDRPTPLELFVPHHSFRKADALPLIPGEVAELSFGLLPVSVLVRKGHRLRVAIGGHDKDTFARIPEKEVPTIRVHRDRIHASHVEIPIIPR
jgi:uncharacterized protein